jgi:hypothetical protein
LFLVGCAVLICFRGSQAKLEELKQFSVMMKQKAPNTAKALLQFQAKHPYEEVPLPPPKQFRDPPLFAPSEDEDERPPPAVSMPNIMRVPKLPPEQFRDSPVRQNLRKQLSQVGARTPFDDSRLLLLLFSS